MLFSFEQFATLNRWLGGFWRIIWLNVLWTLVTVLGLGVLGFGPASYALAAYLDRWFRHGETPPPARAVWRSLRTQGIRPMLMGWVLLGAGAVIGVNLLSLTDWYLRAANLAALGALLMIGCYVFFVMAATDVTGIRRQITTALLLGIGSLHWSILAATGVAISWALMLRFAVPLFPLLGIALPAVAVAAILRGALPAPDRTTPAERTVSADRSTPARRDDASASGPIRTPDRAAPTPEGTPA